MKEYCLINQTEHLIVCRICGEGKNIICWPEDHKEKAICPECCSKTPEGHEFVYEKHEGYACEYCGIRASEEWLADRYSD